ncbi:serine hydrolase [Lactobacillus sp. ESL0680]|uniref:D-alanyl-D-alanine carboxypeptidase family protein n=1 Tax=Lactobacillus sp. ESL0680 TaxID=2983210 RepID=UPI0023F75A5A|nr:serine hydrolase [Lactobacillus sp. ESL0680]WEV38279.1 serine hydrolase [Lactobacillus sp. ESL0680]
MKTRRCFMGITAIFCLLISAVIPVKATSTGITDESAMPLHQKKKQVYSHHQAKTVGQSDGQIIAKKPKTKARAYIVLNRKTGAILLQKNANKKYLTASTGKLMTIYLARRKLANHPHDWQKRLKFSKSLIKMGTNPNFDGFHAKKGYTYTVKQIFESAIIDSDDNSAIRLGQWVAGSNRKFIKMMNKQAKLWHIKAQFTSASGLENDDLARYGYYVNGGRTSGNLLSAKSLAVIAYHVAHDYPSSMKYFATESMKVAGQRMVNQNRMLPGKKYYHKSFKVDGMKTGWTPRAGYCFVGSSRKGAGLITVTLHDNNEFSDTAKLMRFTYQNLNN